ncbi:MAG: hypothetical protein VX464_00690 [Pseudomonadota bacterium]|nr:hypothetical protein [Pseudomonadota bacterium]
MSYRYQFADRNSLLVVSFSETIAADDLAALTGRLKADPRYVPEMDRLLVFDKDTDMSDLSPDALASIRNAIVRLDSAGQSDGGRALKFRSAYVVTVEMQQIMAKLYVATWQAERLHRPQIETFSTISEALRWLGRGDLKIDLSAGTRP